MRKLDIPKMMRARPEPTATIPRTGIWSGKLKQYLHFNQSIKSIKQWQAKSFLSETSSEICETIQFE